MARKRDAQDTQERIMTAAKAAFSRINYAECGVRDIAAAAGVDPALIRRYFGSKAGLFEATLVAGLQNRQAIDSTIPRAEFGRMIVDGMTGDQANLTFPIVMQNMNDGDAKRICRKVLHEHILPPLAEWLGPPDAFERAMTLFVLTSGLALHIRKMDIADEAFLPPLMLDWFASAAQSIVDGGGPAD
jgi:AcrR family transcriptional regulator